MARFNYGHVLITGTAGAIGSALVGEIHGADSGARFTTLDIDPDGAERAVAGSIDHLALACDLSAPETLAAAVAKVEAERGPVDTLVNCAGIMFLRSFAGTSWDDGLRLLNIDLISPLRLMQLTVPGMVARRRGGVINISSMAGRVPIRGSAYYGAAKAGIAMASEISRLELAGRGVRVMTVYPGPIYSYLERTARDQVSDSMLKKWLPTGQPDAIAAQIIAGFGARRARVIYPPMYAAANSIINVAGAVTARLSPEPLE